MTMKNTILIGALLAASTIALCDFSTGHGGTYRGPGDTVPPGAGGGGGGGGAAPGAPAPGAPTTPAPSAPGTPAAAPGTPAGTPAPGQTQGPMTQGGADAGPDLTRWEFWWGFNKDPYLNLKSHIHDGNIQTGSAEFFLGHGQKEQAKETLRPTKEQIDNVVVPALIEALNKERHNDIVTGAMIALAKIGDEQDESGESRFQKEIAKFLDNPSQEIAETAAVALGILADQGSTDLLVALMNDQPLGRKAVGSTQVSLRTRAFATYGLGLLGYRSGDNELRKQIAEHLADVLTSPNFATRDIKIAAMVAFGLTRVDTVVTNEDGTDAVPALTEEEQKGNLQHVVSRQAQLKFLLGYFNERNVRANKTTRHYLVRAHAPRSMAMLLEDLTGDESLKQRTAVSEMLIEAMRERSDYNQRELKMSAALALGQIGTCDDDGANAIDNQIRASLREVASKGRQQARRFSLISLAQIGARAGVGEKPWGGREEIEAALTKTLGRGKVQLKPWAGLAIGVQSWDLLEASQGLDTTSILALQAATDECKRPADIGAYVLGLGMSKNVDAISMIVDKLDYFSGDDDARGYCCVALGLIGDPRPVEQIQTLIEESKYRPTLLKQAAISLGLLGDKAIVPKLVDMLAVAKGMATQAAIATALGQIGDRNSIEPLVDMLKSPKMTGGARGFAAVALGIVCDKEMLPWNSKIGQNINYRANSSTLTGAGTGILDIL